MKIYALICHKLDLTQFWPKVVSWRFEITTDEMCTKLGILQNFHIFHIFDQGIGNNSISTHCTW